MAKIEDRIAEIDKTIEQKKAVRSNLLAAAAEQKRKDETRRKILYGAAFLAATRSLAAQEQDEMHALVHGFIRNPKDRTFLGLDPVMVEALIRTADEFPFMESSGIPFDFDG